jgi:lysophospholipase L1-like esterase
MGFQSGAIHAVRSEWSFPAMIARSLGIDVPMGFRVPRIPGPGLPLDIEGMLRHIQAEIGRDHGLSLAQWIVRFPFAARAYLDRVEDYYERGAGTLPAKFRGLFHNLAVWGFTVRESLGLTPALCREAISEDEGFIDDDFLGVPSGAMYRSALRVLRGGTSGYTQVQALERLAHSEQPEVILVWLGANDCLGTVATLQVHDMEDSASPISNNPLKRLQWNLTSSHVFAQDYAELAERVATAAPAAKVFVATIPEVTIPPITTGIGQRNGDYFEHYARFFVDDGNFHQGLDHLSGQQAKAIDLRIASFNQSIRAAAERHGFHLVDTCALMRTLSVKRNNLIDHPEQALIRYYADAPDHPLLKLPHIPSALGFSCDSQGRVTRGGLFSLDGVHPSTVGYGIIAEAFLKEMQRAGVADADPGRLAWREIINQDALLNDCPPLWKDVTEAASHHATFWNLVFRAIT